MMKLPGEVESRGLLRSRFVLNFLFPNDVESGEPKIDKVIKNDKRSPAVACSKSFQIKVLLPS